MYKIIGGDQKEYGPVTAEELRHWITEGRLHGPSLIQAAGSIDWRPLSTFPEFADALRAQAGLPPAGFPGVAPANAADWAAQILARETQLRVGHCLARSWRLLMENFGLLFGACFLVWMIGTVSQFICVAGVIYGLFRGVFYGGLFLVFLNRIRGRPASVGDVFSGFRTGFAQLLLTGFLGAVLSGIGFLFCILPGLYLQVAWSCSLPLVADQRLEFWSAMELSRKIITRVWFQVFGLLLLAFLPFMLIYLFAQVKIGMMVFSIVEKVLASGQPDVKLMMTTITEVAKTTLPMVMLAKFVLLLNLPFALGALMYAYEDLFGARKAPTA